MSFDKTPYLVSGSNNPNRQVSVNFWNAHLGALETAINAATPSDGDKGDITIAGGVWSIDSAVLSAKGRALIGSATAALMRTELGLGTAALASEASLLSRANHTGTQSLDTTTDSATRLALTAAERTTLTNLPTSTGATLVSTVASGTGAATRTVQTKLRESVSVLDFGADSTGVADSAPAFVSAIAALPTDGGRLVIPAGTYLLNTEPSLGTKSIHLDIHPEAKFTGAGTGEAKFGYMKTNVAQLAMGPYILSQTKQKSTNANGGTAAFQVEFVQPTDYGTGQAVALYAGALARNATAGANTWAANFVHRIETGALGTHQLLEADVDCFSASATVKGISLSGAGTANPDIGLELTRVPASATKWAEGIKLTYCQDNIVVTPESGARGIVLHGEGGNTVAAASSTAISARQYANNNDTILVQRSTDTSPTGHFFRAVNAANSVNVASIDVLGNLLLSGAGVMASASLSSSTSTGATLLSLANTSTASALTKFAKIAVNGQDTIGSTKEVGGLVFEPTDVNWVASKVTLNGRRGDAVAPGLILFGTGSPEAVVTAPVGAIYTRNDGGAGTTLYVKETGTGATGWVAK